MDCGFCGTTVKDGYSTCPNCGATYMKNKNSSPILLILGIAIVGSGFFGVLCAIEEHFQKANSYYGIMLILLCVSLCLLYRHYDNRHIKYKWWKSQ